MKSELITPSLPHKNNVTPSSKIPTPYFKVDIPYSSIKEPKSSSLDPSDQTLTIEKLQQENAQLLQQFAEQETVDRHLHHDNIVLQEKVNSLQ